MNWMSSRRRYIFLRAGGVGTNVGLTNPDYNATENSIRSPGSIAVTALPGSTHTSRDSKAQTITSEQASTVS